MIHDVWIVVQREFLAIRKSLLPTTGAILTFVLILVLFGIVIPAGLTMGWLNTTAYLFLWFWLAWLLTAGPISDSFAGERERHTLDALFATPLSCCAILVGKIAAVTLYAWLLALVALGVSVLITSISAAGRQPAVIQPILLETAAVLTPLAVLLASTSGALMSLNARTARQAHQAAIIVVPAIMLLGLAGSRLVNLLAPDVYQDAVDTLHSFYHSPVALVTAVAVMGSLSALLFVLAAIRLARSRVVPA